MDLKRLSRRVNWKYIAIQFSSFASSFSIFLYVTVILQSKGFTNTEIGLTAALGSVLAIILPPLAAYVYAKHPRIPLKLITAAVRIITLVFSILLIFIDAPVALVSFIFVVIAGTTNAVISLTNALAMQYEGTPVRINFGIARAAGSIGCIFMSVLTGLSMGGADEIILLSAALLAVSIVLTLIFDLPEKTGASGHTVLPAASAGALRLLRNPACLMFFLVMALSFANVSALDTYQINILKSAGGTDADYGLMLILMVTLETPVALLFKPLAKRFSLTALMSVGFAAMMLKDIALIFAHSANAVFWMQGFNVLMIGLFSPAQVYFGNSLAGPAETVQAQALFTGTAISAGRILGNLLGGVIADNLGLHALLIVAALYSALAIVFSVASKRSLDKSCGAGLMPA